MSSTLTNIQLGTSVSTLDGLSVINADQLFVNGENVNPASPNIPIQPSTSNFVHPIVVTTSFGPQTASVLNVDGNTYLGYNPSLRILYTDKLTIGSQIIANGISPGTPLTSTYLALNSSNQVITTAVPATSLVSIVQIAGGYSSPLYFCFITSTASGAQIIYSDDLMPITYNTSSKTLSIKNLTASAGSNWTNYGTSFSQVLQCSGFSASSTATFPQFCNFSTAPNVGTPTYFLALNASNEVVVATGISAQPTITATNTNAIFYLTFAPNATTTSSSPLYVDGGASLTYNAFSNTLTVPIAEIPTSLTANGSFTANGSNSIAGYAPLNSPALSGIPTCPTGFAGTSSNQIASQEFVIDSLPNLGLYMTKTGTNAGVNTVFQFGPTSTDSFEIKRNDGVSLMKLVQNSSQTMTIYNLLMTGVLQAYIFSTSGSAYLGTTLQVVGNTTLSTATGVTPAPGNNSTALATTAYVQTALNGISITPTKITANTNIIVIDPLANPAYGQIVLCTNATTGYGVIHRNDGANYYFLVTDNNNPQGAWNGLRPFYINLGDGRLYSNNGQSFDGGCTIAGQATANGGLIINNGGANYANFGGSSMNLIRGNTVFYGTVATGSNAVLQVDWASGINASVLNTGTYNWQFVTGGSGSTKMTLTSSLLTTNTNINFNVSGVATAGINSIGLYADSAGYFTNSAGMANAGISVPANDLYIYANSGGVIRFYNGSTSKVAIGSDTLYADTITMFGLASVGISRVAIGNNQAGHRNTYGKLTLNSKYTDDPAEGFVIDAGDGSQPAGNYRMHIYPYVQAGGQVGYKFGTHNNGPNYESYRIQHNGDFRFNRNVIYAGVPSIFYEGAGVNWYMNGQSLGYWDIGTSGNNWRMNATNQLQIGGQGGIYCNFNTPICYQGTFFGPAYWNGGCLFTNNFSNGIYDVGVNIGWSQTAGWGHIICLQPSVQWHPFVVSAGQFSAFYFGGHCAYTTAGGWNNISDEREKEDIKPLKTTRSLERVLAAKTYTYKRKFYLNDEGKDLVPDEIKNKHLVGVMAQQIQESNPHCISTWDNDQKEERFGVCYNDYVVHLLGGMQEQQKQITTQQETIDLLTRHLSELTNQVNKLTEQMKK